MNQALRVTSSPPENFRSSLRAEFDDYLSREAQRFDRDNRLRVDLHCHDHHSDMPEMLWGRILGLPETWLTTRELLKCLRSNGSDVVTVTNHNNARSCWELLDAGQDVLVGAEFTCVFPGYDLYCHVLTYGFTPEQEVLLNKRRRNIYEFLRYTTEHDIPVILPHPLYFYTSNNKIDPGMFEKLAVLFQRFEVLNGQRDLWQSILTLNWLQSLNAEKIEDYARRHQLDPADFGVDPERPKILAGGSDDHMGIFAGQCGSYLSVPGLQQRLRSEKASALALEAIRAGHMAPFGLVGESQKLHIALMDYFAQIARNIEDPGLLRILLHRGETSDKIACIAISNMLLELQKNKRSRQFLKFTHNALLGKKPNKVAKWKTSKKYRFCIDNLEKIANGKNQSPEIYVHTVNESVNDLFTQLNRLIIRRIQDSRLLTSDRHQIRFSAQELTRHLQIPSQLTALFFSQNKRNKKNKGQKPDRVRDLVDSISFPLMLTMMITGSLLSSTRALYQNRRFLNEFATSIGKNRHPFRALYLTDTLFDKNGVSNSLTGKLRQIQQNDIAIDFLACHGDAQPEPHLHVVHPLTVFNLPEASQQEIRIPDLLEIARIFYDGGYDRVVCSTEGPMVMVALFLKYMFNVPSYFFMHTDWIEYIKCTTDVSQQGRNRVRGILRLLYNQFDGVFVLNREHREWLTGQEMQLEGKRVHLTAHHAPRMLPNVVPVEKSDLFDDANEETPVLFTACRLSEEKGLLDLVEVVEQCCKTLPELKLVVAGSGPLEQQLREKLPDALFLGWVDQRRLAQLYAGLDLFVFPSRFDTFGNVLLEAFNYGMPAIAYSCKGPRDIIEHGSSGYLVEDSDDMARQIIAHYLSPDERQFMRVRAQQRAGQFHPHKIMTRFVTDLGLPLPLSMLEQHTAA